ncbi:ADP-ribosyl-[dinitrogen reductase] hydrolase [Thiorhodococcus mannitoliphagus]|uniref:ADP-ribosyl-[dinitrogen reductase] hydrolase n=1 Tax=Thiorhodococcus mannitoliphagus TaxID=329406 RepID=A0A6P1E077_9GAMM|nr:ADP-ribosyl-[dinitrogen reductase] hydrolase [Thiorhodococcus mannitoliphagus]NEX22691.1 ADP-ribosyl-[dinitrogen reductase] hydrolase [Thiorhodococcus mannitoliphagus]
MSASDPRNEGLTQRIARQEVIDRAVAAYLGLAIGDALGATVEFLTPREIRDQYGEHRDIVGGGWLRLRKGRVTDDTEMSLALGQSILRTGHVDPRDIAESFSDWMRTKPVDIGHTVRRGISRYRRSGEAQVPENAYDAGNGACMRALPIALYTLGADLAQVAEANRAQSHVTHHSVLADAGTLTVIRMVQTAILGGTLDELKVLADGLIASEPSYSYDRKRAENPGGFIVETLHAVFQALFGNRGLEATMIDVVNRGGDADTTGAILGMIAAPLYGLEALPRRWLKTLDAETRRACELQARALIRRSPSLA